MTPDKLITVISSPVHGRGVVTLVPIKAGSRILEYRGKRMSWPDAMEVHPHNPDEPNHTFIFDLANGEVIDGFYGRCAAKYINHSCDPNCDTETDTEFRVWIKAVKDIPVGVELSFDYRLEIEGEYPTAELCKEHECRCGSANCRGTMLNIKTMIHNYNEAKRKKSMAAAKKRKRSPILG